MLTESAAPVKQEKKMKKFKLLTCMLLLFSGYVMAIEEPSYTVLEDANPFELRAYASQIIAETEVSGDLDAASSAGFRLIADYIFGNNKAFAGGSEKISMTVPVTMAKTNGKWCMHFVMPKQYTLTTLPQPNNADVSLRAVPKRHVSVIRFSWFAGEKKVAQKTAELLVWMKSRKLTPIGQPTLAR